MTPRDRVEGIFITLGDVFTPLAEETAAKLAVKRMLAPAEQNPGGLAGMVDIPSTPPYDYRAPDPAVRSTTHLWANYYLGLYASHTGEHVKVSVEIFTQQDVNATPTRTYGTNRGFHRAVFADDVNIPAEISPVDFMIEFTKGAVSQYLFTMTAIKQNNDYAPIN